MLELINKLDLKIPITAQPVYFDVNNDTREELIIVSDKVYIFALNKCELKLVNTINLSAPSASTPCIGKLPSNQTVMFVGSDDDCIYGFYNNGELIKNFPFKTSGDIFTTPILKDINNDTLPELIFGSDDGRLYVFFLNSFGEIKNFKYFKTDGFVSSSPALFPNSDSTYDIIFASWDKNVYRIDYDCNLRANWPLETDFLFWSNPKVFNFKNNNFEIVIVNNHLYLIDGQGKTKLKIPLGSFTVSTPYIFDIDNDNSSEIVVAADKIYVFRHNGSNFANFPVNFGTPFWASPEIADINRDNLSEIIVCDYFGNLYIIDRHSKVLYYNKISKNIVSTPLIKDIDNDKILELIIGTFDGKILIFKHKKIDYRNISYPVMSSENTNKISKGKFKIKKIKLKKLLLANKSFDMEIFLESANSIKSGILYFSRKGKMEPSPLFGSGKRFIARFPPFRHLNIVKYFLVFKDWDDKEIRVPQKGEMISIVL